MTFDEKEAAKKAFGFTQLPFCAVFDANGALKYSGDPKGINWATVFDAAPAPPAAATPAPIATTEQQLASDLAAKASLADGKATEASSPSSIVAPLGEATNRPAVVLGFGNDDEDF